MTPCLPYMGSKRKLAARILDTIISCQHGRSLKLYDLFGGGGAVSFEALQRPEIDSWEDLFLDTIGGTNAN